jgi:hypothetical protein
LFVLLAIAATPAAGQARCGTERWAIKTLTDPQRMKVLLAPVASSVRELRLLPKPMHLPPDHRLGPAEFTVYRVRAVVLGWKREGDRDFHIVIADSADPAVTMIVEVVDPGCAATDLDSAWAQIVRIRGSVQARLGTPRAAFRRFDPPVPATVTGVGFFDVLHGQTGVAPNGVELHPVLEMEFDP